VVAALIEDGDLAVARRGGRLDRRRRPSFTIPCFYLFEVYNLQFPYLVYFQYLFATIGNRTANFLTTELLAPGRPIRALGSDGFVAIRS
jgi:hypothetical protein